VTFLKKRLNEKLLLQYFQAVQKFIRIIVYLYFVAGVYRLTGLVHISEASWDLVQDMRNLYAEGDEIKVKVVNIDR
jgi:predicted RNA-binding protein with RPS1 domain